MNLLIRGLCRDSICSIVATSLPVDFEDMPLSLIVQVGLQAVRRVATVINRRHDRQALSLLQVDPDCLCSDAHRRIAGCLGSPPDPKRRKLTVLMQQLLGVDRFQCHKYFAQAASQRKKVPQQQIYKI